MQTYEPFAEGPPSGCEFIFVSLYSILGYKACYEPRCEYPVLSPDVSNPDTDNIAAVFHVINNGYKGAIITDGYKFAIANNIWEQNSWKESTIMMPRGSSIPLFCSQRSLVAPSGRELHKIHIVLTLGDREIIRSILGALI